MASIRELRRKIKSVKSTQQITKAMKMVAAARLNRAQNQILSARPFADKMEVLLQNLAYLSKRREGSNVFTHPFLKQRNSNRIDAVLVTSDRGLCGGFNANLMRHAVHYIKDNQDKDIHLWVVGKKGRDFFKRTVFKKEKEYVNFFQRLSFAQADIIGGDLIETFLKTNTSQVVVVYNEFKSRISQKLVVKPLLPIASVPEVQPKLDFIYEPDRREIVGGLFPRFVKAEIYRILLESQAAELAARMTAMENATNNASDLIYSLTLTMNKIRQAAITKEISEIVGGAEALQTN